jgi:hypothetical protein
MTHFARQMDARINPASDLLKKNDAQNSGDGTDQLRRFPVGINEFSRWLPLESGLG